MCKAVSQFQRMLGGMEHFPKTRVVAGKEFSSIGRSNLEHKGFPSHGAISMKWALYRGGFPQIKFTFCSPCACFVLKYASLFKALR